MAIRSIVLRGYGNGVYAGSIAGVVLRGYNSGASTAIYTIISAVVLLGLSSSHEVTVALEKSEVVVI